MPVKTNKITMKKLIALTAVSLSLTMFNTGCKKDKDVNDDPVPEHADVSVKFYHYSGASAFAFNTNYMDDFGNIYQFTTARMYISGVQLRDDAGSNIETFDTYLLITPDSVGTFELGEIEHGHVHTFNLNVGIDSTTNHSDPAPWPAGHPLAPQSPSMHWGWSMGYIFFMLEGIVDTDANGIPETTFAYHVGTDNFLRNSGSVSLHSDIEGNTTLELNIDWSKFFTGINMATSGSTHTGDNLPLATLAADNVPLLFSSH